MAVMFHKFPFSGRLKQNLYPDLFLTTARDKEDVARSIPAHRIVLSAASDKLGSLCKDGGRIVIKNIRQTILEKVLEFIYSGSVELGAKEVEDFRDGLHMLKIELNEQVVMLTGSDEKNLYLCDQKRSEACENNNNSDDNYAGFNIDVNGNIGVKTSFSCLEELWSENKESAVNVRPSPARTISLVDFELKTNDVELSARALDTKHFGDNFETRDLNWSSTDASLLSSGSQQRSPNTSEIQDQFIECEYCGEKVKYKCYVRHCKKLHTSSPWGEASRKCGTCKGKIPDVIFNQHLLLFNHKEKVDANYLYKPDEIEVSETTLENTPRLTKVTCDYCGQEVLFMKYVSHCKKLHNISDSNESCRVKCYKCGTKVHIIAKKFHDKIYHPMTARHEVVNHEPLKVEDKKNMTKVKCEFCSSKVVFCAYKAHVKNKHPEIAYEDLVKCEKCGCKVAKISFKFHRMIFHNSSKIKANNISSKATSNRRIPAAKVSCSLCDAKVRPHLMFRHMHMVHVGFQAGYTSIDQETTAVNEGKMTVNDEEGVFNDTEC